MKFIKIMLLSGLFALMGMVTVQAQSIERTYQQSNGETFTLVRQGERDVRSSDGRVDILTSWGNRIGRVSSSSIPIVFFSPHNGQLPEAPFEVGYKWRHTYEVKEGTDSPYKRVRDCEVKQQVAVTVRGFTYEQAWQITCSNQREFRQHPLNEVTWYTNDRIIITHTESWGGSHPGSRTTELVSPPRLLLK